MSTPREQVQAQLIEQIREYLNGKLTIRETVERVTEGWEISIARDRKAKWRVYLPREPKP